jgi:hypothetical protein
VITSLILLFSLKIKLLENQSVVITANFISELKKSRDHMFKWSKTAKNQEMPEILINGQKI